MKTHITTKLFYLTTMALAEYPSLTTNEEDRCDK